MKLVFTGGCGYIGSHSAFACLRELDCEIIIVDDLSTGFIESYDFLSSKFGNRVSFRNIDINEVSSILQDEKIDCMVHFAGSLSVGESMLNPLLYYHNNTAKTLKLISNCIKYKVKNFIFSSTAAVYGEPDMSLIPIKEDAPVSPINPYGRSKLMIENILEDISKVSALNYIALRYFNVAGACSHNDYRAGLGLGQRSKNATHLIKIASECAVGKRSAMGIFGNDYPTNDGTCVRDYIHVDDLAAAHVEGIRMLQDNSQNSFSEVFNVGYKKGFSVKEIIECVKRHCNIDFRVEVQNRRAGDPAILISNNEKLLEKSKWIPKFDDINNIVKSAIEWERFLK